MKLSDRLTKLESIATQLVSNQDQLTKVQLSNARTLQIHNLTIQQVAIKLSEIEDKLDGLIGFLQGAK